MENYEINVLQQTPTSISNWLDFVALCFAKKGTPRKYFEKQLQTHHNSKEILILTTKTNNINNESDEKKKKTIILSTLCIFYITYNNKKITCGGIGSVCTHPEYQRKGLAKLLLLYTKQFLKEKNISITLLHSSKPALQNYYSKLGWNQIGIVKYGQWQINTDSCNDSNKNDDMLIRKATNDDLLVLQNLYKTFQELLFLKDRTLIDFEYIMKNAESNSKNNKNNNNKMAIINHDGYYVYVENNEVVAYCWCKNHQNNYQLVEFAVATAIFEQKKSQMYIQKIIEHVLLLDNDIINNQKLCEIQVPYMATKEILNWGNILVDESLTDWGWRYYVFNRDSNTTSNDIKDGDNNNNTNETMKKKFFSWRSDSF